MIIIIAQLVLMSECNTYSDCPDGLVCVENVCVKPKPLCGSCWKSVQCMPNYKCLGYDGLGGMCLPMGCVVDDDCPLGMKCISIGDGNTACWVKPAMDVCVGTTIWKANTCGMLYTPFIYCGMTDKTCVHGDCCKRDCTTKQCGEDGCYGSCGMCGMGQACIDHNCTTCIPGVIDYEMCGSVCSAKMRVCDVNGSWGLWSTCKDDALCTPADGFPIECHAAECRPGHSFSDSCGNCGTMSIICNGECRWESGSCVNEGLCKIGETAPCEQNGKRTCTDMCRWSKCIVSADAAPRIVAEDHVIKIPIQRPKPKASVKVVQGCQMSHHSHQFSIIILLCCLLVLHTRH